MQDVFSVQDEVAKATATTIEGRMAASGAQRSRRKPTSDLAAYDCFLQGREEIERRGDPEAATKLLRRAIALDPNFALAYAWLARHHTFMFHIDLQQAMLNEALMLANKAVSLDEADPWTHNALGYVYMFKRQYELAGLHLERAIALNPTDVRITSNRALWLAFMGRGEEAVSILDIDLRRDPYPPAWVWNCRGVSLFQAQRYEEAVQAFHRLTRLYVWDYYYLAAVYAQFGSVEQARIYAGEILKERPNFHLSQVGLTEPFKNEADLNRLLDGLRKVGLPE